MKFKKTLGKIVLCIMVICIMLGGAFGIYMLKYDYSIEETEKMLSNGITEMVDDTKAVIKEIIDDTSVVIKESEMSIIYTSTQNTSRFIEATTALHANAGGELDNSDLKEQEKAEKYFEEDATSIVDEEKRVMESATTIKVQGTVVNDEKLRTALIELGYDPDNYIASELSFSEKKELIRLAYGEVSNSPEENVQESVDYSQRTLEYDGPELPKPIG